MPKCQSVALQQAQQAQQVQQVQQVQYLFYNESEVVLMQLLHYSKTLKDDLVFKNAKPVSHKFLKAIYGSQYKFNNKIYIVIPDTFLFEFLGYLENEYFSQGEIIKLFPKINFKKLKKLWEKMGCPFPS